MEILREGTIRIVKYDSFYALDYSDKSVGFTIATAPSEYEAKKLFDGFLDIK